MNGVGKRKSRTRMHADLWDRFYRDPASEASVSSGYGCSIYGFTNKSAGSLNPPANLRIISNRHMI